MLVIRRTLEEAVVVDRRIVLRLYAVGQRDVLVKVSADGGPEATFALPVPRSRREAVRWFPLAPGVRVGVSDRVGFQVRLAFEAPKEIPIDRQEILSVEEHARVFAPRLAEKGGASEQAA